MIDLHSHSTFSDGSEDPARVVELAAAAGCRAVALTDHDVMGGLAEARHRAEEIGIELIDGCELSGDLASQSVHVLCYFVAINSGPLHDELAYRLQPGREERNHAMIERLRALGLPVSYEELAAEAHGRGIGRPHFAAVLTRNGAVASIEEAFDRYLGEGKPGYVEKLRLSVGEIVDLATRSGGVAAIAHPLSLGLSPSALEHRVAEWADLGVIGLESYYGRYGTDQRADLAALARRHGLVPTGGSDFHGTYKPDLSMGTGTGDLNVPDWVLDELVARREAVTARGEITSKS